MSLHFTQTEFRTRRAAVIAQLQARNLDGILLFKQESMYYLTGYDTFGFCFFQCLYLGRDGRYFLLTRTPDLRQAQLTSDIEDIRIWVDGDEVNPADDLRAALRDYGVAGQRLGCEYQAYGLSAADGKKLEHALAEFCELEDASTVVSALRVVKSEAEMAYVTRAAQLADDAMDAARATAGVGVAEGTILAAMHAAIFEGGGDYPANEFIIGSGDGALLCRYFSGRRVLTDQDQLTLEYAGVYRHYHACLMQTFLIGTPNREHVAMHAACEAAMDACVAAIRPGASMGAVYAEHARVLDAAGYHDHRLHACGYSLGAVYSPVWMDYPMFYANNPYRIQPNNVFFVHIVIADSAHGRAMSLGQTLHVTTDGVARLSRQPTSLVVV